MIILTNYLLSEEADYVYPTVLLIVLIECDLAGGSWFVVELNIGFFFSFFPFFSFVLSIPWSFYTVSSLSWFSRGNVCKYNDILIVVVKYTTWRFLGFLGFLSELNLKFCGLLYISLTYTVYAVIGGTMISQTRLNC